MAKQTRTTAQLLADLMRLRDEVARSTEEIAQKNHERAVIASQVFGDKAWIALVWKGDYTAAAEHLKNEFFADMLGAMGFLELMEVVARFPTLDEWREHKHDLSLMHLKIRAEREQKEKEEREAKRTATPRTRKVVSHQEHEKTVEALEAVTSVAEEAKGRLSDLEVENRQLRDQVAELRAENRLLREMLGKKEVAA